MCKTRSWPALFSFSLIQYHCWELFLNFMKTRLGHKHVPHWIVFKELELRIIQTRKTWHWKIVYMLYCTSENLRLWLGTSLRLIVDLIFFFFLNGQLASQSGRGHHFFFSHFFALLAYQLQPLILSLSLSLCSESSDFSLLPTENNPHSSCHSRSSLVWPGWALQSHFLLPASSMQAPSQPNQTVAVRQPLLWGLQSCLPIIPSLRDHCFFPCPLAEPSTFTSRVMHSLSWGLSKHPTLSAPLFFPLS